jgi:uncharacterized protein (TIGR02001 family)
MIPLCRGGVELSTQTGLYVGTWGSTISDYNGARAEIDAYAGYRHDAAGWALDVGGIGYFYPSGTSVNGFELYGSVSRKIAQATIKAGASYTPEQGNFGVGDGTYVFAEVATELPRTPFTLRAHFGREAGVNGGPDGDKLDWLIGADTAMGPATVSLAWADTDVGQSIGSAYHSSLIASLAIGF